jgi:hypothetical protein
MADPLPTQPATPGAPPSPSAARAPGIVQAFVGVITRPAEFYASVRDAGGFGAPVVFALVCGLAAGVISAVYAVVGLGAMGGAAGGAFGAIAGFSAVIVTPIFAVIGCFVGGAIVHVISLIAGGKGTYEQSVRVGAYAGAMMPISALLGFVPLLRLLPGLYALYLVGIGLITIHAAERKRTWTVMAVLAAILVLLSILGMLAGRAVQKMGTDMRTQFGPNSEFQREIQKAQQEMQRAAEEAKRRQQQAPPPPAAPEPAK